MLITNIFYAYLVIISLFAIAMTLSGFRNYRDPERNYKYAPKTLVIVPCKGLDYKMDENLAALKNQDYKNYGIVAVVDSPSDNAARCIKKVGIRLIVAKKLGTGSGKVNAVANAIKKFHNYEAYVIADSDTLMKPTWLGDLVKPLRENSTGLSTAYPYFKGVAGVASRLKCAWGLVGEGMMESEFLRFGWGGSLAFKRELIQGNLDEFANSLSDDIALGGLAKRRGLKIAYVKSAQPTVRATDTFPEFVEWSNRQTALSVMEDRKKLWIGLPFYVLNFLLLVSAILLTIFYSYIAILLFIPIIQKSAKTYSRLVDKSAALVLIDMVMPAFYAANLIAAIGIKSISWRGRRYRIQP